MIQRNEICEVCGEEFSPHMDAESGEEECACDSSCCRTASGDRAERRLAVDEYIRRNERGW